MRSATAITDSAGFYYFADMSALTLGGSYSVGVTIPRGFKNESPSSLTFGWSANPVLGNFLLY